MRSDSTSEDKEPTSPANSQGVGKLLIPSWAIQWMVASCAEIGGLRRGADLGEQTKYALELLTLGCKQRSPLEGLLGGSVG